jgi:hypothetical protein
MDNTGHHQSQVTWDCLKELYFQPVLHLRFRPTWFYHYTALGRPRETRRLGLRKGRRICKWTDWCCKFHFTCYIDWRFLRMDIVATENIDKEEDQTDWDVYSNTLAWIHLFSACQYSKVTDHPIIVVLKLFDCTVTLSPEHPFSNPSHWQPLISSPSFHSSWLTCNSLLQIESHFDNVNWKHENDGEI